MPAYLFKTEPSEFSFQDHVKKKQSCWDGVANPAALIALRSICKGDEIFIYHTGDEKTIVGTAVAAGLPYPDPKRPELTADGAPKFAVIELRAGHLAKTPLSLAQIKSDPRFSDFALVKQSRLSVMPVPPDLTKIITKMLFG